MLPLITLLLLIQVSHAETKSESCKDILHGFLSGQISSALGDYQIKELKREFKSFTETMKRSMKEFKEKINSDLKTQGMYN
jgi:uncharacterized protein YgfB (UPF0149 family)